MAKRTWLSRCPFYASTRVVPATVRVDSGRLAGGLTLLPGAATAVAPPPLSRSAGRQRELHLAWCFRVGRAPRLEVRNHRRTRSWPRGANRSQPLFLIAVELPRSIFPQKNHTPRNDRWPLEPTIDSHVTIVHPNRQIRVRHNLPA